MGMNVIPLKDLTPDEPKVVTVDILKNMDANDAQNEKLRGQLVVELIYKHFKEDEMPQDDEDPNAIQKAPEGTPAGGGVLVVLVYEAEDVEGKHHTNPQVRILFRGEERRTKVYKSDVAVLVFFVVSPVLVYSCCMLKKHREERGIIFLYENLICCGPTFYRFTFAFLACRKMRRNS